MNEWADVIAETTTQDGTPFRAMLVQDTDAESPREWLNASVMHMLDQPRHIAPRESDIYGLDDAIENRDFRVVARWLRMFHGATVVLPLYWATGDVPSAGERNDAPTAGNYAGVTFDTAATRRDVMDSEVSTNAMAAALAADVQTYAQWAEGEVYGYVVENAATGESVDSCWGHIGYGWAEEAAREALGSVVAEHDDQVAQATENAAWDENEILDAQMAELGGWRY